MYETLDGTAHLSIYNLHKIYIGGLQSQDIYQDERIMKSRTTGEPITRKWKFLFRTKKKSKDPGKNLS